MTSVLAEVLRVKCPLRVVEASASSRFEPGVVHIAPTGLQMHVLKGRFGTVIRLDADFCDSLHVPSIDVLFSSAATAFGAGTIAVLLTGLGKDGVSGMARVRRVGGHTIAELAETAASYAMPGAAVEGGVVVEQLPIERIGPPLVELAQRGRTDP